MGRKPGSLNRKTMMMLPMLEALDYRDPALVLGEYASMPQARLKKLMSSEAGRAAVAARLKAASELMPYCHAKMAVKVDIGGELPVFHILGDRHQLEQEVSSPVVEHVGRELVGHSADLFESIQQSGEKADD
jgi:hypothetical protein